MRKLELNTNINNKSIIFITYPPNRNLLNIYTNVFVLKKSTLIKAIEHDNILGIPGLTEHAVKKYLPESTATIKGNLHQTRKNIRSTRSRAKLITEQENNINDDLKPQENKMVPCELFCFAAVADEIKGTVYTDLPGRFPSRSYKGNQYIFLTYVYDDNAIIV